jgi:hypothetical protein
VLADHLAGAAVLGNGFGRRHQALMSAEMPYAAKLRQAQRSRRVRFAFEPKGEDIGLTYGPAAALPDYDVEILPESALRLRDRWCAIPAFAAS